ncbi:MAG: helix-hairpin-helix domain-containing protein [Microbacteriaceae bacterium]|nr:helix-hairpin-helix domain-containing protein [Microbacteriaceae bacterium]
MSERFAAFLTEWVYPRATFLICAGMAVVSIFATLVAIVSTPASGEAVVEVARTPADSVVGEGLKETEGLSNVEEKSLGPVVHVVGAVKRPGLVHAKLADRVIDAIELAGGLEEDADQSGINFARFINDGEQIYVPRIGEISESGGASSTASAGGKINLNRATASDLESLPRIGPATALKIIAWRDANGSFTDLHQLMNIAGIGQKTFDGLVEYISL